MSLFPVRVYVPDSPLVSAIHHQINDQIGVIGENLNSKMFSADTNVSQLADTMKNADVPFPVWASRHTPGDYILRRGRE